MQEQKNRPFWFRLQFALAGVWHGVRTERSLQTQAVFLILVVVALLLLRPAAVWWALVLMASCAVIAAELFNTAIERLADRLHPDQHPEIRIVKDCAAAAVLVISLGAVAVAVLLLLQLFGAR